MDKFDKKILIIDDEKHIRNLLRTALKKFGYDSIESEDGMNALKILEQNSRDTFLVITDVFMPNLNGIDFLKIAKTKYPIIEFVVLTALSSDNTVVEALKYGATFYSTKPINLDEIKFIVEKLKENYIIRMENRKLIKALEKNMSAEAENIEYKFIAEELRRELIQKEKIINSFLHFIKEKININEIPSELSVFFEILNKDNYSEM